MMFPKLKVLTIALFIATVSACSVVPHNHIDKAARASIKSTEAYLTVAQQEIDAEIVQSNTTAAAGGGLLFALIDAAVDNSRTKTAENLIQPIRDGLIDYDFAAVLHKSIGEEIEKVTWLNAGDIVLERTSSPNFIESSLNKSSASAVLFTNVTYKLSPNFDSIKTTASTIIYPKDAALNKYKENPEGKEPKNHRDNNIYRNLFTVDVPLFLHASKNENAKTLSVKPDLLVKALDKSAKELAIRISNDLDLDETADKK